MDDFRQTNKDSGNMFNSSRSCIYASLNYGIIDSDNNLSPITQQCQAIIWIKAGLLLTGHWIE